MRLINDGARWDDIGDPLEDLRQLINQASQPLPEKKCFNCGKKTGCVTNNCYVRYKEFMFGEMSVCAECEVKFDSREDINSIYKTSYFTDNGVLVLEMKDY